MADPVGPMLALVFFLGALVLLLAAANVIGLACAAREAERRLRAQREAELGARDRRVPRGDGGQGAPIGGDGGAGGDGGQGRG